MQFILLTYFKQPYIWARLIISDAIILLTAVGCIHPFTHLVVAGTETHHSTWMTLCDPLFPVIEGTMAFLPVSISATLPFLFHQIPNFFFNLNYSSYLIVVKSNRAGFFQSREFSLSAYWTFPCSLTMPQGKNLGNRWQLLKQ